MFNKKQMIKVVGASLLSVGLLAACSDGDNNMEINEPNGPNDGFPNEENDQNLPENEDDANTDVEGDVNE